MFYSAENFSGKSENDVIILLLDYCFSIVFYTAVVGSMNTMFRPCRYRMVTSIIKFDVYNVHDVKCLN